MARKYNHKAIEEKWQKYWLKNKTFRADLDLSKPKYYVLDMFPYPSGAGLHVGHVEGYTATDVMARFKRMNGFNVLHPMGWDSFGLPAEQYAVRTGTHPAITTQKNIDNFRRQLQALGFSYDWDREIATSDPSYYKWTQWIFTKLYEMGLAYEAKMYVNYCPNLGTVLANEEVENGKSKEGGHPVERRPLRQWMLKITAYAERLLEDLNLLDWPESLKALQVNWIGKSEGALIHFPVVGHQDKITVYTTRHDTLFGATFMVLAPEHPLVAKITTAACKKEVEHYCEEAFRKQDMDRTDLSKEKTGVFTGAYAINPATEEQIPIWVADYVLISYATGAIMAVPAHDDRDFEFAKKYGLPIRSVFDPHVMDHPELIPEGESPKKIREEVIAGKHWWPNEGTYIHSENSECSLNGLTSIQEGKQRILDWLIQKGFGEKKINYKMRDWLFSRQRYWGEPFPIYHLEDGRKRVLDLDELPLLPPEISDYKPTGDGQSPLAKQKDWIELIDPKTGLKAKRESNTMPQWAGSCWYYLRFCDPQNQEQICDPAQENYWLPVDLYVGGVEHAVLHLLYARFWHKVLFDCGVVTTVEPFMKLRNQGLIVARAYQNSLGAYVSPEDAVEKEGQYYHRTTGEKLRSQIEKMSKSKLNGVTPDEIIEEFGADSLRLYELFMGPLEKEKIWNTDAVNGCRRFLSRFFDLATSDKVTDEVSNEALRLGHRLVYGVTKDTEKMYFNTAIAKMMEFVNDFVKLPAYSRQVIEMAALVLSPYAPHLAEEVWELLGNPASLADHPWPKADTRLFEEEMRTYVIQINGKVRGKIDLPKDQSEELIVEIAKTHPVVQRYLNGVEIEKTVFVPNKLLNLVVKSK